MAKIIKTVTMDLGGSRTGTLLLPEDVADYFGITVSTTAAAPRTRTRKAHTRQVFATLAATATAKTVAVPAATWTDSPSGGKRGSGKKIIVPTELKTTKGSIRMVTMRFPSQAVIGAISEFLFTRCLKNKPTYFLTASGVRHAVINITGDVNPTPPKAATPAPTP